MQNQESVLRKRYSAESLHRAAHRAHEALADAGAQPAPGGRPVDPGLAGLRGPVRESWQRSLLHRADPDTSVPELVFHGSELEDYRSAHPLAEIMPVIRRLLVRPGADSGLLVAVGDELGRLLWVDGDADLLRRAEGMLFVPGSDWSERVVGTSAPGAALATQSSVQIVGAEHFSRQVHSWSCTAVPVRDPDSGVVLGVVDITGKSEAVAAHTLSLVEATVAAAEAELRIQRLQSSGPGAARRARPRILPPAQRRKEPAPLRSLYRDSLQILGRDTAVATIDGRPLPLGGRHAELLTLLALHPGGLTSEQLAVMAYPEGTAETTVRAEMLRLRKLLRGHADGGPGTGMVPQSRPYRLPRELMVDARQVLGYLERGAHCLALGIYRGPVLPRSEAPAIVSLRSEVSTVLREAMLSDAGPETLFSYLQLPEAADDVEAWTLALRILPPRSPKRAAVVARLERLEAELG